jgi:outer membrane protein TolC
MKKIFLLVLLGIAARVGFADDGATNVVVLTPELVNRFAEEMRTNHPALAGAVARTNAAAAGLAAVRTWDDPTFRFGGLAAEETMRREDGDILYGAEQKLPLWGKPALARRVARAELGVESANADYQFQILRSAFAKAMFRTALAERVVAVGEQDLVFVETMTETMDARFQAGTATLVEVLQLQSERAKRATQLQTDRARLAHERLTLNRFLNRDLQSPWPSLQLPPLAAPVIYNQRLADFAAKYEPKLRMMREQIKQVQAMVDSKRRSRLPDVSVGVDSRNYSGNGEWRQLEFMLNFNLPLFNRTKYRADIRRDEAKLKAAEADAADYSLGVGEEIHNLTVKIESARREAVVYRDEIIPRSESALESARAGWAAGRNSFRDVLDARRMLLDARLMFARAISEQYQMLSELVLCCGLGDLEALQMIEAAPEAQKEGNKP